MTTDESTPAPAEPRELAARELADKIVDGRNTRANVRIIMRQLEEAGVRGAPVPATLAAALPIVAARLLESESDRIQAAGAKLVLEMLKHNLALAEFADKCARLDAGTATQVLDVPVKIIEGVDPRGLL
jgi:hypothetical protein